jgi:hypothetical protein
MTILIYYSTIVIYSEVRNIAFINTEATVYQILYTIAQYKQNSIHPH